MFTYQEVKTQLDESTWPQNIKDQLGLILPQLGLFGLSFISSKINATGSSYDSAKVINIIQHQPLWYKLIDSNQQQKVIEEIAKISESESGIVEEGLLAIVQDIRANPALQAKIKEPLNLVISLIEIKNFKDLYDYEVEDFLSNRFDQFAKFANVFEEIKRYCYYRNFEGLNSELCRSFIQSLSKNDYVIGRDLLTTSAGQVQPSIRNWLQDFLTTADKIGQQDSFGVAHYMTNHTLVKNLSESDKQLLTEVIKLYIWLHQPIVSIKEVEEYENTRDIISVKDFVYGEDGSKGEVMESSSYPVPQTKIPLQKNLDIGVSAAQQKRGLIFDVPTNIDLDKEAEARKGRDVEQDQIQAKLEELKKRKK